MGQSRPPPVRTHGTTTPPQLSPRTAEKKHHSRRKSGRESAVLEKKSSEKKSTEKKASSSEKKAVRPAPLVRRTTPSHLTRVTGFGSSSSSSSNSRSTRERERERDEDGARALDRDGGESFPQYCMTCEKQFLPLNTSVLYCSDSCRLHDQGPSPGLRQSFYSPSSPPLTPFTRQFPAHEDGPDIIPPFSPSLFRPSFYSNSDPEAQDESYHHYSASPPRGYTPSGSSSALDSLRTLATALPKTPTHPSSPPRSAASSLARTGSGVWDYIPFASGKTAAPTPSATPANSYSYAVGGTSPSYGAGRSREDLYAYGKSHGYGNAGGLGLGMDRPLPPRTGPSGYGHRPRSIDLVTPFSGH